MNQASVENLTESINNAVNIFPLLPDEERVLTGLDLDQALFYTKAKLQSGYPCHSLRYSRSNDTKDTTFVLFDQKDCSSSIVSLKLDDYFIGRVRFYFSHKESSFAVVEHFTFQTFNSAYKHLNTGQYVVNTTPKQTLVIRLNQIKARLIAI